MDLPPRGYRLGAKRIAVSVAVMALAQWGYATYAGWYELAFSLLGIAALLLFAASLLYDVWLTLVLEQVSAR